MPCHDASRVEHMSAFCGIISGTARHSRAKRSLTRLLDYTERGLAVKATRRRTPSYQAHLGEMLQMRAEGMSYTAIGAAFGVNRESIRKLLRPHVDHHRNEVCNEVLRLRAQGMTYSAIAAATGINRETARKIVLPTVIIPDQPPVITGGGRTEQWRPVVGWEGFYEVSDFGRVWSCPRLDCRGRRKGGLLLKQSLNKATRRFTVGLSRDGKVSWANVHVLVLEAFAGPRPKGYEGCHGPNGALDNRWPENVYWATRSRNQGADKRRDGTWRGSNPLAPDQVIAIRSRYAAGGIYLQELAAEFGVTQGAISDLIHGKTWSWLPGADASDHRSNVKREFDRRARSA